LAIQEGIKVSRERGRGAGRGDKRICLPFLKLYCTYKFYSAAQLSRHPTGKKKSYSTLRQKSYCTVEQITYR
jgi:hypothetical protein